MSHRAASGPFSGCGSYVTGPGRWLGVSAISKVIEPWAMDIIKETSTYAEVSPWGKGRFHALAMKRIKIPARQRKGAHWGAMLRRHPEFLELLGYWPLPSCQERGANLVLLDVNPDSCVDHENNRKALGSVTRKGSSVETQH